MKKKMLHLYFYVIFKENKQLLGLGLFQLLKGDMPEKILESLHSSVIENDNCFFHRDTIYRY